MLLCFVHCSQVVGSGEASTSGLVGPGSPLAGAASGDDAAISELYDLEDYDSDEGNVL